MVQSIEEMIPLAFECVEGCQELVDHFLFVLEEPTPGQESPERRGCQSRLLF
jgi:hypothetical protein